MISRPRVFVIGVGMTKFEKPGSRDDFDYPDMVKESVGDALKDAQLAYTDVQQAIASYIYGPTCCGQRALYEVGMTGIPIYNVNNACASGSSGVILAKQIIESGNANCVLVVGFEKMQKGSLDSMPQFTDRANPVDKHLEVINDTYGLEPSPITCQMFGNAGREHMKKYGTKPEHFAKIGWKNHKHSVHNPRSQFRDEYTLEQIVNSRKIHDPLTKLQCSPTSDGSAAAVLCSEAFLNARPHLRARAVEIVDMVLKTDYPSAFEEKSNMKMVGYDAAKAAASELYSRTGLRPEHVNLIELHDCFSANELITYEALQLCPEGKAGELIDRGDNTYGGKWVVNPSGGLISKGHPIGATGVAQIAEISWQLRGEAGKRQVPAAKLGMQHNIGIGGAVVLGLYKLATTNLDDVRAGRPQTNNLGGDHGGSKFKADQLFTKFKDVALKEATKMRNINASYQFLVDGGQAKGVRRYKLDLTQQPPLIGESTTDEKADCVFTISDDDLSLLAIGKLNIQQAFMQGKVKLKGNLTKAMKLRDLLNLVVEQTTSKL